MSFREKSAWVTLTAILLVFLLYITHAPNVFGRDPGHWELHVVGVSILAFIVIEIVTHVVLYLRFPKDARTPKDERERLLDLKATRLAAYVFVLGTFVAIMMPHWGATGFAVTLYVVLAFVVAEVVNYTARIIYYRRG